MATQVYVKAAFILLGFAWLISAAPTGTTVEPSPTSLLGYNSANGVVNEDTANIQYSLLPGQTEAATVGDYLDFNNVKNPQPIRGSKGGTDPGPRTEEYDILNPDKLAPPGTDHGSVANAEWPLGLSHMKLGLDRAGWSRQQNIDNIPAATDMAGVDMRLEEGAYRELHWHKAAEWSYILKGSVRVEAVNEEGQTFVDDLSAGDVWYFPPGIPHSLQGLEGGVEFLLVFDDGDFSEDNTFLASEVFAHNPKTNRKLSSVKTSVCEYPPGFFDVFRLSTPKIFVRARTQNNPKSRDWANGKANFDKGGLPLSAWDKIPAGELFIFPGTPAPTDIAEQNIVGSAGIVPVENSYTYHLSKEAPTITTEGGSVKIVDPKTFPLAEKFSAAIVTVKPGAVREIHWHTTSDEWNFFVSGSARIGIFAAQGNARTFDYHAGDCGYIPRAMTHYVENIGKDDVVFIEVLQADHFSDISVGQWVGLTPPQIIMDTLNLTNSTVSKFKKEKQYIVQG
ncbi:oxalate decarboxylase [Drepanopeziza brunnea f. sp. 'multigermtubi' MB_m1]|uniref:Oxalate decarboxylase n=1 Tax=Marssonina brunnea f. sp. multigermtubi (strain MB_m1) TaxID=1072389 RepID=K1X8C3_MARBU|nr:oxalate decarboxylase [Drepanopeziza brunnea f. sp. 'multigermtubi' MB_m1]EKD21316.1 oxalate decarboxylase [Drepanopeziza brunnea f. sp. 'multigermtubi' MB_m1]